MYLFEVAALGAAATWAVGGLISAKPAAHLGAIGFNCVRMLFVVFFSGHLCLFNRYVEYG